MSCALCLGSLQRQDTENKRADYAVREVNTFAGAEYGTLRGRSEVLRMRKQVMTQQLDDAMTQHAPSTLICSMEARLAASTDELIALQVKLVGGCRGL